MSKSLSSILRGTNYGTLPISAGGTGGNTAATALTALGAQAILPAANGSANGYLTSTDWTTFNSKLSSYTLPTAGASTLGGIKVGTGLTIDVNGILTTTNSGTVTSVAGTAPIASSGGATPTISIAAATTSASGYLTSTDWNTFNSKQAALVSATNIKTVNGTTLLGSGDLVISGGASATKTIANKTAAYTVIAGDLGKIINCTSGTFTISLTAAATLGAGFTCTIWNTSNIATDAITIDPNLTETIDGISTLILRRGEGLDIVCDGTNWEIDNKKPMRLYAENYDKTLNRPIVTGGHAVAIGGNATASGGMAVALSYGSSASGSQSMAIGFQTNANSGYSTAIGVNSGGNGSYAQTGAGAMSLGGSYASGTNSFAAGVAGNTNTYGAQGLQSIAMGYLAKANNNDSVAIGNNTVATGDGGFAIGKAANATGAGSYAGSYATASGSYSIAFCGLASSNYSVAIGYNSSGTKATASTGSGAMALGGSYASGTDSFAAAIANNTSSYGAKANNSIAIGKNAATNGFNSISIGNAALNNGSNGIAIGTSCTTSNGGVSIGTSNNAVADKTFAIGYYSQTNQYGKYAYASGQLAANGDAQSGKMVLRGATDNTTPTVITSDGAVAGATNQVVLPNQGVFTFSILVTAVRTVGEAAGWKFEGVILRTGAASGTQLLSAAKTTLAKTTPSWECNVTADTTNGALAVTVTGAAVGTKWVAVVDTAEVIGY
jgi:hypothetical protein